MNDTKKGYTIEGRDKHICKIGINELDEIFDGGIPRGSLISVRGPPGIGKTIFAAKFVYEGSRRFGEKGVYLNFTEDKNSFYKAMLKLSMDFKQLEKQEMFVYIECPPIPSRDYMKLVLEKILTIVMKIGATRLVIDSLNSIIEVFEIEQLRELLASLRRMFKKLGVTTLVTLEHHKNSMEKTNIVEYISDIAIRLNRITKYGSILRYMEILKARGRTVRTPRLYFRVSTSNGIEIFKLATRGESLKTKDIVHYVSSNIKPIDEFVGFIPKGSQVLIVTDPELDALDLLIPILASLTIRYGGPTIIKSYTTSTDYIRIMLINYLKKLNLAEDNVKKVLKQISMETNDTYLVNTYESVLMDSKEDVKVKPMFKGIHNVNVMMEFCDKHCLLLYLNTILNRKKLGITSFYTYTMDTYSNKLLFASIYDIIIKVEREEVNNKLYYKLYRLKHPILGMSKHYALLNRDDLMKGVY